MFWFLPAIIFVARRRSFVSIVSIIIQALHVCLKATTRKAIVSVTED